MRHRVYGKHLKRDYDARRRLRMQLLTAMVQHERIETTEGRAEFIRADVEKLITIAKKGLANPGTGVHARRQAASQLNNDRDLVGKLFNEIAPRFTTRPGGYTRVYKLGPRKGDAAPMVLLELVDRQEVAPAADKKADKKDAKKSDKGADKK
jgi:large subunit ribosomal protein L17